MPALPENMSCVEYEVKDRIAYITLNRPEKLNAINDQLQRELKAAFVYFDLDQTAQIAIISGKGRAFSSGADVRQRQLRPREELESFGIWEPDVRRRDLFYDLINWKPMIAAVHGYAYGAAFALAFRCDLVITTAAAKFQITEIPRGLNGASLWSLLHFRGAGTFADDVTFTGRQFTGEEAYARGVVTAVAPEGEHLDVAREYAARVMKNPPLAVRNSIRVRRWQMEQFERQAALITEPRPTLYLTRDFHEAARAWAEKREPAPWEGR